MQESQWMREAGHPVTRAQQVPDPAAQAFGARIERLLTQAVILGLVLLVLVQALLTIREIRNVTSRIDRLEGVAVAPAGRLTSAATPTGRQALSEVPAPQVTVALVSRPVAPGVRLLVAGRAVGDFGAGSVTARVPAGALLEIDARSEPAALTFRLVAVRGLTEPRLGQQWQTLGERLRIGLARPQPGWPSS